MARRPTIPMNEKWASEFVAPRGPAQIPTIGEPAPDFELPYARFFINTDGQERIEYGKTIRLSELQGQPVVLELTRIVSDRFF